MPKKLRLFYKIYFCLQNIATLKNQPLDITMSRDKWGGGLKGSPPRVLSLGPGLKKIIKKNMQITVFKYVYSPHTCLSFWCNQDIAHTCLLFTSIDRIFSAKLDRLDLAWLGLLVYPRAMFPYSDYMYGCRQLLIYKIVTLNYTYLYWWDYNHIIIYVSVWYYYIHNMYCYVVI